MLDKSTKYKHNFKHKIDVYYLARTGRKILAWVTYMSKPSQNISLLSPWLALMSSTRAGFINSLLYSILWYSSFGLLYSVQDIVILAYLYSSYYCYSVYLFKTVHIVLLYFMVYGVYLYFIDYRMDARNRIYLL